MRGFRDLLPPESVRFQVLERVFDDVVAARGFQRWTTPVLERTALFARSLGDDSDVVSKEMFAFETRGQEAVALRPENTASVVRAFLSAGLAGPWRRASTGASENRAEGA